MGKLILQTDPSPIAADLVAYADDWRIKLGLSEWNIWLCENDAPGGETGSAGYTDLNTRYLRATITVRRGLTPERVRSVIRHELWHVALAFIDQVVRYIVAGIPEGDQERLKEMYIDAEEQTIERLVRALSLSDQHATTTTTRPEGA